jgi:cyclophilin family peptidyl-prolyl cis-trans isomerase
VFALQAAGCSTERRQEAPPVVADAGSAFDPLAIARAEDLRRAKDVTDADRASRDVLARRLAARALARIADADSEDGLYRALDDEDPTTVAWGAFGLGAACKGREAATVRALSARATSIERASGEDGGRERVDPRVAIARAVGRCGGKVAESVLASWVRGRGDLATAAAYALGDVVGHKGALSDETMTALLDAASSSGQALENALYPFARLERVPDAFSARVASAARAMLGKKGLSRVFAVRALGRSGPGAAGDLAKIVLDRSMSPAERADAAWALRGLGNDGRAAAADALAQLLPSSDALDLLRLAGDDYGVLVAVLAAVGPEAPKKSEATLFSLAALGGSSASAGTIPPTLAHRVAELRCTAAGVLAKGAYDADALKKCDAESSEPYERARLAALLRRPLVGDRRTAWRALAKSPHVRIREAALEAIADHPEIGDAARAALADALSISKGGIVETAAEIVHDHPDRVLVLSEKERRAALDPTSPPPTVNPSRTLDPSIASALQAALAHAWPEDLVETRAALLDAAVAVSLDGARARVMDACRDRNATMRERAAKALRELGDEAAPDAAHSAVVGTISCAPPPDAGAPAAELGHAIEHDTKVVFSTDAGDLTVVFEPALAPIAASRFVALAKARFYDGIVIHRVVPGFVAQFGDPDGDGYGGAGTLLRCETSPVPFGALDVGVALAGRDTGSSQLFVALARVPHLDGEYARVGRAEGDWWAVAEGDVIRSVKVLE